MTKSVRRKDVTGLVVALLIAGAVSASARGLWAQGTLRSRRLQRQAEEEGRTLRSRWLQLQAEEARRELQKMMQKHGWSEEQIKEATEIAEKLGRMENRLKRILDEPCPTELADISFSNAVMMARGGDPGGYFAMALHYGSCKYNVVEPDEDRAWNLLKKSADMGCPIGALFLAMAEELRIYEGEELYEELPDFSPYLADWGESPMFYPFVFKTNDTGRVTIAERCSPYSKRVYSDSYSYYSVTNSEDVAYIRKLYEQAIALGCSGARGELARFEESIHKAKRAQAEFAEAMLGIPIESKLSLWKKAEDARTEAEERLLSDLEERVTVLEKRIGKEGR